MIRIYGMNTCPDCTCLFEQIKGREDEFEYIEIGSDVRHLKEFLRLRDRAAEFDEAKKEGYIGIPCFVREDGSVTLRAEDTGLKSRGNL